MQNTDGFRSAISTLQAQRNSALDAIVDLNVALDASRSDLERARAEIETLKKAQAPTMRRRTKRADAIPGEQPPPDASDTAD